MNDNETVVAPPPLTRYLPVAEILARLPLPVGERRFRETARRLKLNRLDGRQMMIRPADVDAILEAMTCSKSKSEKGRRSGKFTAPLAIDASGKALARLAALKQKKSQRRSKAA